MSTPYRLRDEPARDAIVAAEPAKTRALGRLRSTHATGKTVRRAGLAGGSIALVLAVMALTWPGAIAVVAVSLVVAAVIATWVGLAVLLGLDVTVHVHENGLRIDRSARASVRVPFDAVRALYVQPRSEWQLELDDGRTVYVPMNVDGGDRLRVAIEHEIEKPVLADALRALAGAELLTFGEITLELDGLRHRGVLLPWSDLDHVDVSNQAFIFVRKATQLAFVVLPASTVPYPRVLVALLARRTDIVHDDPFWVRWV